MKKLKNIGFIITILFLLAFQMKASDRSKVYNAYVSNRMEIWKNVIDSMDRIGVKSDDLLLELVNYQYGYIGYCFDFNKKEQARNYLDLAEENIETLENKQYKPALVNAYKCAFYGFRIELNRFSAPVNGVKSLESGRKALELDSNNYFVCLQYGIMLFNMPSVFGGSREEGIEYFLKAKMIIEREPSKLVENWNYLSLLVIIAQSYAIVDDLDSAKAVYEKILMMEPDFIFVKNILYPELLKKMN